MFHGLFHGLMSTWLGDPRPKNQGRLSLNIFRHLDLFGTFSLIFFGFGWAKPVQIDPRYYKNVKLGTALVALAGPVINFIMAFFALLFSILITKYNNYDLSGFWLIVNNFLYYLTVINVGLGVFNLIPFPPLDGSKVLAAVLPDAWHQWLMNYERFGMFALIGLLMLNVLDKPLQWLMSGSIEILYLLVTLIVKV
jgi:Zn-dependent protease